ncbi:MAG: hypothetical protein AAGB31_16445 [Bdellovibrio sp.]
MNTELGVFALRQMLASMAVVGPILILIGLFFYIFTQDKKSMLLYLFGGVIFTLIGGVCLYSELRVEKEPIEQSRPVQ